MKYTLFGSKTSPFVRRTRMLLESIPYEFKEVDVFGVDAEFLNKINPINQIPVLLDGDKKIWDSRIIFNYLNGIHKFQEMTLEDENRLTAIDGAMNSAVTLLLMKRSGINPNDEMMYVSRQRERIDSILDYLKPFISGEALDTWNIHTMSLYSFLDWGTFRGIVDLRNRPECQKLLNVHGARPITKTTDLPRT